MSNHSKSRTDNPAQLSFDERIVGVAETPTPARWSGLKNETVLVRSSRISLTGQKPDVTVGRTEATAPTGERIYPHIYDAGAGPAAIAMGLIRQALEDARAAADAYNNVNLREVSSRLGLIATSMARAHLHTEFNECLGAIVSYIRRATLQLDAAQISLAQIVVLIKALSTLLSQPMLNLNAAADLTDEMERTGLRGEHKDVEALIASLLEDREDTEAAVVEEAVVEAAVVDAVVAVESAVVVDVEQAHRHTEK